MDALTLFGLFAVTAVLVFYALEERSHHAIFGFAFACGLGSDLRLPARRVAVRRRRSDLGARGAAALDTRESGLAHDPEKYEPVSRKDRAQQAN
jgi:hypothetical protein